ncbi:hypothetical protein SAMN02745823_02579 [Sporobacter termitidis DSM 10068]|uniref:DUF4179 domain-containing protein n=1 Tax=Sporobacter termitidis DSM 10068 TaxID=1123282 RepID=A0A1M5YLN3_9FIRM|nr:hypothetical protein [Sporobacter termitidis]SHI12453.1 hypothetical protein SAMN02745823_02579 [Sporobacter termitidis DSM 10068]
MISFDKDEKFISDALDVLDLELAIPDLMSGIRHKLDVGTANPKTRCKPMRVLIVAAAVVAVLGLTAAAASLGGFDWLLKKANPPFGDAVKPIEQSTISQGIKVTAVAAESSGDMAILYVTLEDTEHLGRVTEDMGIDLDSTGVSMSAEQIYFDKETGIAAYQIRLGSTGTFDGQSLSLKMNGLLYGGTDLGEIRMGIDLAKAAKQGEHIGQPYSDPKQAPTEQLTPGHLADIPGTKSAWVSAIGINHGYLAVQFAQPAGVDRFMDANKIQPYLLDAGGNIIVDNGPGVTGFKTDAQLHPIHTVQQGAYDFMEYYFAVDTATLDGYTLCFKGSVWDVISGEWKLDVNFDSLQHLAREVKADITVGKVQLKDVVLKINPFGMTLTGYGGENNDWLAPHSVKTILETKKGNIELQAISSSSSAPGEPYELIWYAASTIDIDSVIAVRIGDNRIELKNQTA